MRWQKKIHRSDAKNQLRSKSKIWTLKWLSATKSPKSVWRSRDFRVRGKAQLLLIRLNVIYFPLLVRSRGACHRSNVTCLEQKRKTPTSWVWNLFKNQIHHQNKTRTLASRVSTARRHSESWLFRNKITPNNKITG